MGYVATANDMIMDFDIVDYSDFNIPAPTPPPLPFVPLYYKDFDSVPMEVSENLKKNCNVT
jgi:hypothetical protein